MCADRFSHGNQRDQNNIEIRLQNKRKKKRSTVLPWEGVLRSNTILWKSLPLRSGLKSKQNRTKEKWIRKLESERKNRLENFVSWIVVYSHFFFSSLQIWECVCACVVYIHSFNSKSVRTTFRSWHAHCTQPNTHIHFHLISIQMQLSFESVCE